MLIGKIVLSKFRNYDEISVAFSPRTNLIRGENAQGKTNLLEAIYFLCTGRSFRTLNLVDLIPYKHPFFLLEAHFIKDGVQQTLRASFDGQVRKLSHNETHFSSFSPLLGLLPIVMIAPQDLSLVGGAPADRRRFLDLLLAQSDPLYVHHLTRYFRAMKQRNALLRRKNETAIEGWEYAMAEAAHYLLQKREGALAELAPYAEHSLQSLSQGRDQLTIQYQTSFARGESLSAEALAKQWQKNRRKELHFGTTLLGPHRDEILLQINGKAARNYSSEGQKRSLVIALRLAEWKRLKQQTGYPPLLCIDDFGIHLDAKRYQLIQQEVRGEGQVFLTTPFLPDSSAQAEKLLLIESGTVVN